MLSRYFDTNAHLLREISFGEQIIMKKITALLIAGIIALLTVSMASAQINSYSSGFQVANQSSNTATIVIQYINQDGTVNTEIQDTIDPNGSKTYFPIGASAGFNGSVVISSNESIVAITNVLGNGFDFGASYESFSAGAASVNLPLVMKENFSFNTWFNVQNASSPDSGSDVNVTVTYPGTSCTETATIKAGAAATFNQQTNTCLPSGHVGSASITATGGDIVATVMQVGPAQLLAYNGFTGGSNQPVMPLVQAANFGFFSGIQLQNTGSASTDVTVSYAPGTSGTACTETQTIAAGQSATFALASSCAGTGASTAFVGSASVTTNSASQPLVGIVNQTNFSNKGSAYNALNENSASATVSFPLIMQDNFGFFTGFNVFNAGGASASVTCTFSSGANAPATINQTLAAGASFTAVQTGSGQYVGSATCTAAGGSLLGVANELGSGTGDDFFAYIGFNQ